MLEKNNALKDAVIIAMEAEKEAVEFYGKAAKNTEDSSGKNMFLQLVNFEKSHYAVLKKYLESLSSGNFEKYEGVSFEKVLSVTDRAPLSDQGIKTDIDAISIAIEAEKKARKAYDNLAASVSSKEVKAFFNRLAYEEELHRRVLEDQFLMLSNNGRWGWGE